jgi:hypothetical protein
MAQLRQPLEVMRTFRFVAKSVLGFWNPWGPPGAASLGSALARSGICADICSGCAMAGLSNRHMVPTSAAANRRTSMRFGNLRTGCSRLTGCRDAACGGFLRLRARSPWWREWALRLSASRSCCFVLIAGSRDSIPSQSLRSAQAAGSRRPYSRRQREPRDRADANLCGLKFMKEISEPSGCIVRPGIVNSADTTAITRTAVTRLDSRSNSARSMFKKEPDHDGLGHRC